MTPSIENTFLNIRMSPELLEDLITRDEQGRALTLDIGEPGPDGFFTPTITVHHEDNVLQWHRDYVSGLIDAVAAGMNEWFDEVSQSQ